ncbi:MAG: Gldg family protein, partial [Chitinophagaceae bacterium]|nr:Gldg family protein [Chitinophagaceae bacterium]
YYDCDPTSHKLKDNPGKSLKEIGEKEAKSFNMDFDEFVGPEEIRKLVDVNAEEYRCFFILKYKNKSAIVRTFMDMIYWPTEDEIAAALNRLVETPPKIGFVTSEIERGPFSEKLRDYKGLACDITFRHSLMNQGFDFDTLSLDKPIQPGYAALVLADPRVPFQQEALERIGKYIDEGGNLMVMTEPDRREVVKPVLDKLGITQRNGLLIQPSTRYSSDLVFNYMTTVAKNLSPQYARKFSRWTRCFGDTSFKVALPGASALEWRSNGFVVEPLLVTNEKLSWNRTAAIDNDSLQLSIKKLPGDEMGTFVTALKMHRMVNGKEQRVIVAGDADYLTRPGSHQALVEGRGDRYNDTYAFWCLSYFSYGKFPANTLKNEPLDNKFHAGLGAVTLQKAILIWIIPGVMAIGCMIILIRRKRK